MTKLTTKEKILNSAAKLFAEKGYHDTTCQDIIQDAGVNIAAVNYHYGSKDKLYLEVWKKLIAIKDEQFKDIFSEDHDPFEALKVYVTTRIRAAMDEGPDGWLPRIIHFEMGHPTAMHKEIKQIFMGPHRKLVVGLVRRAVGEGVDEDVLPIVGFLIHAPLIHVLEHTTSKRRGKFHEKVLKSADLLADVIHTYMCGGIEAIRKRNKDK